MTQRPADRTMRRSLLSTLPIGSKLSLGFALLVGLTLVVISMSLWAGNEATATITSATAIRQPTTADAYRAQASLYSMIAELRAYLVLGEPQFMRRYESAEQDFQRHLDTLESRSASLSPADQNRLRILKARFARWKTYPEQLFALRDDQLKREPAYAWLNTDGADLGGQILINTNTLIDQLARRPPSEPNNLLLRDVSQFQSSFAAMFSGLRGYVTTRNPLFRSYEFQTNLDINNEVWRRLRSRQADVDPPQQALLTQIDDKRNAFLAQIPERVFEVMQSAAWRKDLYLFANEAVPLNSEMQQLLDALTESQQQALGQELSRGSASLSTARIQTLIGGAVAVLLGMGLAVVFRQHLAGPIRRLTQVAEQIRMGDLVVQATVETGDEIGTLATTFNAMTGQLRHSLAQVREEKQRVDNLLEVVIPIGVALSAEKDYQRLLETILLQAKAFCQADAGILYLQTQDRQLRYVIICDDLRQLTLGGTSGNPIPYPPLPIDDPTSGEPNEDHIATYVAGRGIAINLSGSTEVHAFAALGPEDPGARDGWRALLALPLKNSAGQVLGVLQLCTAQDAQRGEPIAFDPNLQRLMESFSSLAAAALEAYIREQSLRQEIRKLRIEVDEVKRQQHVSEIVETDFFQQLRTKAHSIRSRGTASPQDVPTPPAESAAPSGSDEPMLLRATDPNTSG